MHRLRSSYVLLLVLALGPMLAIAAEAVIDGIQIEGASNAGNAWLSTTLTTTDGKETWTNIYEREEGRRDWHPASAIANRVAQLTHYGDQLIALLPDGQWLFVGESTGQSLPDRGRIYALAGDASTLWAVGEPGIAPTTRPTTAVTRSTIAEGVRPATTQASGPKQLSLFQFVAGKWLRKADLPRAIWTDGIALGMSNSRPVVAFSDEDTIFVQRLDTDAKWTDLGRQPSDGQLPRDVIADGGHLFVYLAARTGPDHLLVRSDHWLDALSLKHNTAIRSMGLAGSTVRYVYAEGETLRQRSINARTLQVDGADEDIVLPEPTSLQRMWGYLEWVMIGMVGLVVLHTYRQREEYRKLSPDWNKVQLAPFGRRIFAGMVDLLPLLTAAIYARLYIAHVETPSDLLMIPQAFKLLVWGTAVYLAHTTVIESVTGRSLGKIITRLHVIRLDGGKPPMGALALRNLLRCVDLVLWFTPIFMFYLPLRQRVGDMAATTVVVADREKDLAGPDA